MASPAPAAEDARQPVTALATFSGPARVAERREMSYIEAVNAALRAELAEDDRTLLYGEDVGKSGGTFAGSRYLQRDFGADRVFDTPVAENAILGSAVGAAVAGAKPIVEIMWAARTPRATASCTGRPRRSGKRPGAHGPKLCAGERGRRSRRGCRS